MVAKTGEGKSGTIKRKYRVRKKTTQIVFFKKSMHTYTYKSLELIPPSSVLPYQQQQKRTNSKRYFCIAMDVAPGLLLLLLEFIILLQVPVHLHGVAGLGGIPPPPPWITMAATVATNATKFPPLKAQY